jgi:hypothetical protein
VATAPCEMAFRAQSEATLNSAMRLDSTRVIRQHAFAACAFPFATVRQDCDQGRQPDRSQAWARGALYADGEHQYLAADAADDAGGYHRRRGLLQRRPASPACCAGLSRPARWRSGALPAACPRRGIGGSGYVPELTAALALARDVTVSPAPDSPGRNPS